MAIATAAPPKLKPSLRDTDRYGSLGLMWVGVVENPDNYIFMKAECKGPAKNLMQIASGGQTLSPFLDGISFKPKQGSLEIEARVMGEEDIKTLPDRADYNSLVRAHMALNSEGQTYVPADEVRKYQTRTEELSNGINKAARMWISLFNHYERKGNFFANLLEDLGTKDTVEIKK
jgi:hypothetical protein